MKIFANLFVFCLLSHLLYGEPIEKYFKKAAHKIEGQQVRNIDFIYLINLDQRPEKLVKCMRQLAPYRISPYRFSAVYGWDLSLEALNTIGLTFTPSMKGDQWVTHFPLDGNGSPEFDFLRDACFHKTFFSRWMTRGAIGCTLSHLSILQDAYDSGYQTIWIMEDDIEVKGNPHLIADLIDKLDVAVGKDTWDILYTDADEASPPDSTLNGPLWWMWRPDMHSFDTTPYAVRSKINANFIKIGSRTRTHSMIIRRSGIKKILDYSKSHHIFIPYDHELALAPNIQLYMLSYPLVTWENSPSDTQKRNF